MRVNSQSNSFAVGGLSLRVIFHLLRVLCIASTLFPASQGWAVIRVDVPIAAMYDVAKLVLVCKVVRVDPTEKVVDVEITGISKGSFAGTKIQIQMADIGDYMQQVEINQPVVIFNGVRGAQVHLADNFLSAEPLAGDGPPKLKAKKVNSIQPMFPGRTVALIRLLDEVASGHSTLLNLIEHVVWNGGIKQRGKVLPNADYVVASDLNGDGNAEVLIGNRRAIQLLVNSGTDLTDETTEWGLRKAKGKWAACGDIDGDGRVDLLVGNQFWLNKGGRFVPGPVLPLRDDDSSIIAVGLLDATGHGRPDAVLLEKNGQLQVYENPGVQGGAWRALPLKHLWNDGERAEAAALSADFGDTSKVHAIVVRPSGLTRYALDLDGGRPAQFDRLTSETLKHFNEMRELSLWKVIAAVPLDINGDGLKDLTVILERGGPTLVNRGFGTFFLNPLPAEAMTVYGGKEVPWRITPGTRFAAGDIHGTKFEDLLIVTEDGRLYELNNPPYERHSTRFQ